MLYTSGEDEEGERAADSLLSPSSSFSSKQKRQQLLLSAGRACGEKERTQGGDLKERACGKKQRSGADNSCKDEGAGADNCGSYGRATGWERGGICDGRPRILHNILTICNVDRGFCKFALAISCSSTIFYLRYTLTLACFDEGSRIFAFAAAAVIPPPPPLRPPLYPPPFLYSPPSVLHQLCPPSLPITGLSFPPLPPLPPPPSPIRPRITYTREVLLAATIPSSVPLLAALRVASTLPSLPPYHWPLAPTPSPSSPTALSHTSPYNLH